MWLVYVSLFVVLLGLFTFLTLPKWKWKGVATAFFLLFIVGTYVGALELLGVPKPLLLEMKDVNGSRIVGIHQVEGEGVYLWIMYGGQPVTYYLPWTKEMAGKLTKKWRESWQQQSTLLLDLSDKGEIAKDEPPHELPPKQIE